MYLKLASFLLAISGLGWPRNAIKAAADRGIVVMRRVVTLAILAALPLGLVIAGGAATALAAAQDGNWSVLVITEQGTCDRGYRYSVKVANGLVIYQGDSAIRLNGTVAPN